MNRLMFTFLSHSQVPLPSCLLYHYLYLIYPQLSHSLFLYPYLSPAAVRVICLLWGEASGYSFLSPGPQGSASWWKDSGCQGPTPQSPETKLQGHSSDGGEYMSVKLPWNKWRTVSVAQRFETQTCDILTSNMHQWNMLFSLCQRPNTQLAKSVRKENWIHWSYV